MRRAVAMVVGSLLFLGGCGGADTGPVPTAVSNEPSEEEFVLQTSVSIAPTSGAEVVATGEVLDGSTLGGSRFCVGGTIQDSHADLDPEVEPYGVLARNITCSDGTVKMGFTPEVAESPTGTGTWTVVSGTGAFEGLSGSGEFEVSDPAGVDAPASETYTGTVTH
jgi:hypothetical protein